MPENLVNPIFYRKSVPNDHLKISILPWMFTFPSVKCFFRNNPRYREKVSGIEIRLCYTICFYKPTLHFKISFRGINFSIFSLQV